MYQSSENCVEQQDSHCHVTSCVKQRKIVQSGYLEKIDTTKEFKKKTQAQPTQQTVVGTGRRQW